MSVLHNIKVVVESSNRTPCSFFLFFNVLVLLVRMCKLVIINVLHKGHLNTIVDTSFHVYLYLTCGNKDLLH